MTDMAFETREDMISALFEIKARLEDCADFDQRTKHTKHRNDFYVDLISGVDMLIDAELALKKRVNTVGR